MPLFLSMEIPYALLLKEGTGTYRIALSYFQVMRTQEVAQIVDQCQFHSTVIQDNGYFEIFAEDGFVVFSVMAY